MMCQGDGILVAHLEGICRKAICRTLEPVYNELGGVINIAFSDYSPLVPIIAPNFVLLPPNVGPVEWS